MQTLNIRENIKPMVIKALNKAGNVKNAAPLLGVTEKSVYNLMKEMGIVKEKVTKKYNQFKTIQPQ